jgi:hypothetical protein
MRPFGALTGNFNVFFRIIAHGKQLGIDKRQYG